MLQHSSVKYSSVKYNKKHTEQPGDPTYKHFLSEFGGEGEGKKKGKEN